MTGGPFIDDYATPSPRSGDTGQRPWLMAYKIAKTMLAPPLRAVYDINVEGLDNVPDGGGVVMAANHRSFIDWFFITVASPTPVAFLGKPEYFDRQSSHRTPNELEIPPGRGSISGERQTLSAAAAVIGAGGTLGIYPEGGRSRDGKLHRGNLGPARLAGETGAPVVPVGLIGTEQIQLPNERLPHPFRPVTVTVRFGPALYVNARTGENKMSTLRSATDQIMGDIASLSGQQYDDHYA